MEQLRSKPPLHDISCERARHQPPRPSPQGESGAKKVKHERPAEDDGVVRPSG